MSEAGIFEDLTELQRRVVVWCHDTGRSPWDAAREGIVRKSTVQGWTIPRFRRWLDLYRATLPKTEEERLRRELRSLVNPALRVLADTLNSGEGDATAVRAARWIVEGALAQLATEREAVERGTSQADADAAELANVLELLR